MVFVNARDTHFDQESHLRVLINALIVETIIGEPLFHPDDVKTVRRERSLKQFKKLREFNPENEDIAKRDLNKAIIKTSPFFICSSAMLNMVLPFA